MKLSDNVFVKENGMKGKIIKIRTNNNEIRYTVSLNGMAGLMVRHYSACELHKTR